MSYRVECGVCQWQCSVVCLNLDLFVFLVVSVRLFRSVSVRGMYALSVCVYPLRFLLLLCIYIYTCVCVKTYRKRTGKIGKHWTVACVRISTALGCTCSFMYLLFQKLLADQAQWRKVIWQLAKIDSSTAVVVL